MYRLKKTFPKECENSKAKEVVKQLIIPYKSQLDMLLKSGFIKERTIYCRHSANSCYCNALKGFGYYFGYTIAIKLLLVLLNSLYTKDLRMLLILKKIFNMQTLNISFIIASLAAAYKISLCTLRSIRNADSKYDNVVARLLAVHAFVFNRSIIGKYK